MDHKLASSSKYMLYSHVLTFISGIALVFILPRVLDSGDYVQFGVYSSLINFLIPLAAFGLPSFIIGHFTDYSGRQVLFGLLRGWKAGLLLSSIALLLIAFWKGYSLSVLGSIYFLLIFNTCILVINTYSRINRDGYGYFVSLVVPKLLLISLVFLSIDLTSVSLLLLWSSSLLVSLIILLPRIISIYKLELERLGNIEAVELSTKKIMIFCFPVAMSNIAIMAIPLMERLYMKDFVSYESLGAYIFTIDFMSKFSAVMLIVLKVVVYPKIMLKSVDAKLYAYKELLKRILIFLLLICFLSPAVIYIYNEIFPFLFKFEKNIDQLMVYCIFGFIILQILNYVISIGAMVIKMTKYMLLNGVFTLFFHYIGLMLLVPNYGVSGAALSLFLSSLVSSILFLIAILINVRKFE